MFAQLEEKKKDFNEARALSAGSSRHPEPTCIRPRYFNEARALSAGSSAPRVLHSGGRVTSMRPAH